MLFVASFLQCAKSLLTLLFPSHQVAAIAGRGKACLEFLGPLSTHHIPWSPRQLGELFLDLLQCFNPPGFPSLPRSCLLACLPEPVLLHGVIPASTGICFCFLCKSQGCSQRIFSSPSDGSSALQDIKHYLHFNIIWKPLHTQQYL